MSGFEISAKNFRANMQIPPQLQKQYDLAVRAGLRLMFDEGMREETMAYMDGTDAMPKKIGEGIAAVVEFEAACAQQPGDRLVAPKKLGRDTVAALFHTGGTTGLPKLAQHTHGALALAAWTNALPFGLAPEDRL